MTEFSGEHTLLNAPPTYRPMKYPWAFEAWHQQQKVHWLALEIPMGDDVNDWQNKLTPEEKNLLTQIFRFFTQADVEVGNCYNRMYMKVFRPTEVLMMLTAFSNIETVHMQAYAHLLDTLGMPEVEFSAFMKYKEMKDKYDYMQGFSVENKREIAKTLAAFGAFTEGLQLFASFAMLLNFPRFNKMKGMGQVVSWSVRDESLHCDNIIRLFRTFVQENPEIWDDELKKQIYQAARDTVSIEDDFIDEIFEGGPLEGLDPKDLKIFIRARANLKLGELGLKMNWKNLDQEALKRMDWFDALSAGVEHADFFNQRVSAYSKGVVNFNDDMFGDED
jgi:ribonucleoside-diphosphate reductase beta chain